MIWELRAAVVIQEIERGQQGFGVPQVDNDLTKQLFSRSVELYIAERKNSRLDFGVPLRDLRHPWGKDSVESYKVQTLDAWEFRINHTQKDFMRPMVIEGGNRVEPFLADALKGLSCVDETQKDINSFSAPAVA